MKPLIGITPEPAAKLTHPDSRGAFCDAPYSQAVQAAGGLPVILPLTDDVALLDELLCRCDGILLSGGGDASEGSSAYGRKLTAAERKTLGGLDPVRDAMEIYLVRQLVEQDKPVLGICRGIQMMNVALGGTLLPDVSGHRHPEPAGMAHDVEWVQGKALVDCRQVNSSHHQALDRVAPGLQVLARAGDGVIEAVEVAGMKFGVGVQFHPERLVQVAPRFLRLFKAFVAAARRS